MMAMKQVGFLYLMLVSGVTGESLFGFWKDVVEGETDLIPEWMPACFQTDNIAEVFQCLQDNMLDSSSCITEPETVLNNMGKCVLDAILSSTSSSPGTSSISSVAFFTSVARECLDPMADCISATIQDSIATKIEPTCLPAKMLSLTQCASENAATCVDACEVAWDSVPDKNPWMALNTSTISTCSGIQTDIVDPSCAIVTCCEPCVQPYEELMDCLVNEVLSITNNVCDFQCTLPVRRNLRSNQVSNTRTRSLLDEATDGALSCLEFAPGLTGTQSSELAARAGTFMPCLANEFAAAMRAAPASVSPDNSTSALTTAPTSAPTSTPTSRPSSFPSLTPSSYPSSFPSELPSSFPSADSTAGSEQDLTPTSAPSLTPTKTTSLPIVPPSYISWLKDYLANLFK